MKKIGAIVASVIVVLGIGAAVYWGTSWKRATRSTGAVSCYVTDEYFNDNQHNRVVCANYADDTERYFWLVQKNGLWSVAAAGTPSENGVASFGVIVNSPDSAEYETRFYVSGNRELDRTIYVAPGELPESVAVGVYQGRDSYSLRFTWYSDPEQRSESHNVKLEDIQRVLTDKGLL